ncbi:MAG: hypothetical protein QW416_02460 [Candidatus Nitrosocaldaceae archaeon]
MEVNKLLAIVILSIVITGTTLYVTTSTIIAQQETRVLDTTMLSLGYQRVRPGQFIHIYDTTPYPITSGHLAVHIDCDDEGVGVLAAAIGSVPDVEIIEFNMKNMIHESSEHGEMCLYHLDLPPEHDMIVTDISLINTGDKWVRLSPEAGVTVTVHSLGEAIEEKHGHEEGSSTGM